ncbi:hypothetical protein HSX11_00385 [Oxalobacteraceae bacterium]|nr:hypothetical protein [Oxalobacteraceae bacterium]
MLFPEDPEKRPELWHSFRAQLGHDPMCLLIANGKASPDAPATRVNTDEQAEILRRMQAAKICRISANHGNAISPHFAATLIGHQARVCELMALPNDGRLAIEPAELKEILETAILNLLYAQEGVSEILIPLQIPVWEMADADIHALPTGLLFRKKGVAQLEGGLTAERALP